MAESHSTYRCSAECGPSSSPVSRRPIHLLKNLNQRELGFFDNTNYHSLLPKCRRYKLEDKFEFPGKVFKSGEIVINRTMNCIVNVKTSENFEASEIFSAEKIRDSLIIYATSSEAAGSSYIMILTSFGRLLVYDLKTHLLVYKYQMSVEFKYGRLRWSMDDTEVYILASENVQTYQEGIVPGTPLRTPSRVVLAVFSVCPMRFKVFTVLDIQIEGAALLNNILVCFKKKPGSIIVQNFDKIYKERCDFVDSHNELANSNKLVPMNLDFTADTDVIMEIFGHFENMHIGNMKYLMLTPSDGKANITEFHNLREFQSKIVPSTPNKLSLKEYPLNMELNSVPRLFANLDGSDTLLFFHGRHIACDFVETDMSVTKQADFVIKRLWETNLVAFNGAESHSFADNEIVVTCVNYDEECTLLLGVAFLMSTGDRAFASMSRKRWSLFCYLIDRDTGEIHDCVKLNMPCPDVANLDDRRFSHDVELENDFLTSTIAITGKSYVSVYNLKDPYQISWRNDIQRESVPFPVSMNRQQKRKAKQAAARAVQCNLST